MQYYLLKIRLTLPPGYPALLFFDGRGGLAPMGRRAVTSLAELQGSPDAQYGPIVGSRHG